MMCCIAPQIHHNKALIQGGAVWQRGGVFAASGVNVNNNAAQIGAWFCVRVLVARGLFRSSCSSLVLLPDCPPCDVCHRWCRVS